MKIELTGPTGRLITGSVADCDRAALTRALQMYDRQLYIKWNPKKRGGHGMWEIRRRPDHKALVYQGTFNNGMSILTAEWQELNLIAHVMDVEILSREVLGKIQSMDSWAAKSHKGKGWTAEREYEAALIAEKIENGAQEDLRYNIKQHRREWQDLLQLVSRGEIHPAQLLRGMKSDGR